MPIVFYGVEDRAFPHGIQGKTVKRSRKERKRREEIKIEDKQHKFDIGFPLVSSKNHSTTLHYTMHIRG